MKSILTILFLLLSLCLFSQSSDELQISKALNNIRVIQKLDTFVITSEPLIDKFIESIKEPKKATKEDLVKVINQVNDYLDSNYPYKVVADYGALILPNPDNETLLNLFAKIEESTTNPLVSSSTNTTIITKIWKYKHKNRTIIFMFLIGIH